MKEKDLVVFFDKLKAVIPKYKKIPEFMPEGKYKGIIALTYDGLKIGNKKTKIFAYLGYPKNLKKGEKRKAIVLVHGGGGHAFLEWVRIWNELGYIAIAMNTVGDFPLIKNCWENEGIPSKFQFKLHGPFLEKGYTEIPDKHRMENPEDPFIKQIHFHSVASVILARNLLASLPEVDENKIGITGVSWGGVIASSVIGFDNRFAFAIPIYGSAYVSESYSDMWKKIYNKKYNKKFWVAEKHLKNSKIPILWLCWNDDCCFSINSNSKSYLLTAKGNAKTNLSMINCMLHSHKNAFKREESYAFAESITEDKPVLTKIIKRKNNEFILDIDKRNTSKIKATLYYINHKPTYKMQKRYGCPNELYFMDQIWQKKKLIVLKNKIKFNLPKEAKAYYVEITTKINGKEIITTSQAFNF